MYDDHPENVFYGTDDGYEDASFGEFELYESHYNGLDPERREDIHMVSVVGGLYGLNFIPLWRPRRITFFDINPAAVTYLQIILQLIVDSRDVEHFLGRLKAADYEVETEQEEFVRENIRLKQAGCLPRSRGSTKRSYEESWKIAFDHFALTQQILKEAQVDIRTEPMESGDFREWIRRQENLWIYCSNIAEFHYFDLEFANPRNVVVAQIIRPGVPELLDLAPWAEQPVRLRVEIPLRAERLDGTTS